MATNEARAYIKVLFDKGLTIKQIKEECDRTFDTDSPNESAIKRWCHEFKLGRKSVLNKVSTGRPPEINYSDLVAPVKALLQENRRTSIRSIADTIGESRRTVHKVMKEVIGLKKLTPDSVPHSLSLQQKEQRVRAAEAGLSWYNKHPEAFLECFFTQDETWVTVYDPLSRTESKEWVLTREELSERPTSDRRDPKVMASVFWDCKGIIKIFWIDQGSTVDGNTYRSQLTEIEQLLKDRREKYRCYKTIFLQDNARPHKARETMALLKELNIACVEHPPYSPDLAPSDFYLFSNLKRSMRGKRYSSIEEVKHAVEAFFAAKPPDWFKNGISQLPIRWQRCIAVSGDYLK